MRWSRGRRSVAAALALVVLIGALVAYDASGRLPGGLFRDRATQAPAASGPTSTQGTRSGTPAGSRSRAGSVLPAPRVVAGGPTPRGIAAVLDPLLDHRELGQRAGAVVIDASTGRRLFERSPTVPLTPASLTKLLTATAALTSIGPATRFETRVVAGTAPGDVVLVGGGDPTLTAADLLKRPEASGASLRALAAAAAATLTPTRARQIHVYVDDSAFAAPVSSPTWPATYLSSGVVARVSALTVDAARLVPGRDDRSMDPALDAGRRFAELLRARGVEVAAAVRRKTASPGARRLARVFSPPVADVVERMLRTSDNDIAEALLRQVAIARRLPATFAAGTSVVIADLSRLSLDTRGVVLNDGSGLSRADRVPARLLAALLSLAASPKGTALRPLLTGLPVAGFSGTLATRFTTAPTRAAAGVVRAKTGTLTGVSALAGTVALSGHLLVFALLADAVPVDGTLDARDRLDRVAAALASCGCR